MFGESSAQMPNPLFSKPTLDKYRVRIVSGANNKRAGYIIFLFFYFFHFLPSQGQSSIPEGVHFSHPGSEQDCPGSRSNSAQRSYSIHCEEPATQTTQSPLVRLGTEWWYLPVLVSRAHEHPWFDISTRKHRLAVVLNTYFKQLERRHTENTEQIKKAPFKMMPHAST